MRKIAILLCIVIIGVTVITFAPTLAQDSGGTNIPIPTPHPVDELVYELTTVGGEDVTRSRLMEHRKTALHSEKPL